MRRPSGAHSRCEVPSVYRLPGGGRHAAGEQLDDSAQLMQAIIEGAALRARPIAMTVAVIIAGLLPIMWGSGTGSEVIRRNAAPMVGGMVTAPPLSMFVIPVACFLARRPRSRSKGAADDRVAAGSMYDQAEQRGA